MFHTRANFSIFKKLEKFIQHYTLEQKFFHFRVENWKNSKSHLNGPRGRVSPDICLNGPREGVRPKICGFEPRGGVSPNIC
jgi:hypothetical protein